MVITDIHSLWTRFPHPSSQSLHSYMAWSKSMGWGVRHLQNRPLQCKHTCFTVPASAGSIYHSQLLELPTAVPLHCVHLFPHQI